MTDYGSEAERRVFVRSPTKRDLVIIDHNEHVFEMKSVPLTLLAVLTACQNAPPTPQMTNVEVVGSPSCLANITTEIQKIDIGIARLPVWTKNSGMMEIGPINRSSLKAVAALISEQGCVENVQVRPCARPLSDVQICPEME